jgi:DNA-binding PadR family transcriptional regulator
VLSRLAKTKGLLRFIILGIIISNERIHGYRIHKLITEITRGRWKPSIGTTYRLLNELLREGYITAEESSRGRRRVVYYKATEKGINEFLRVTDVFTDKIIIGLNLIIGSIKRLKGRELPFIDDIRSRLYEIRDLLNRELD